MDGVWARRAAMGFAALVGAVCFSHPAAGAKPRDGEPRKLLLEVRGAVVSRDVDGAPAAHQAAFDREPNALTWGFEAAHFPFRVRRFGAAGIGVGFHYLHHEAVKNEDAVNESRTVFQLVPLSVGLVGQIDGLVSCCDLGLIPYGKVAIMAAPWKLRRVAEGKASEKDDYESESLGGGTTMGPSMALGVRFLFDAGMGRTAREADTALFVEYARSDLSRAEGMSVELTWWTAGVAAMW